MFRLDCEFCDSKVEADAVEAVKERANAHLERKHYDSVVAELSDRYDEVSCPNGCGYAFPVGVEDVAGLDCPRCGHDNTLALLKRYVYWQITES